MADMATNTLLQETKSGTRKSALGETCGLLVGRFLQGTLGGVLHPLPQLQLCFSGSGAPATDSGHHGRTLRRFLHIPEPHFKEILP